MKHLFDLLFVNLSLRELKEIALNNAAVVFAIPMNKSLKRLLSFQIGFANGVFLEFYTDTISRKSQWEEPGCIVIRPIYRLDDRYRIFSDDFIETKLKNVRFDFIDKLIYEEDGGIFECGVVLGAEKFGELYICVGENYKIISVLLPENFEDFSVSTQLPEGFKNSPFSPGFDIKRCKRVRL